MTESTNMTAANEQMKTVKAAWDKAPAGPKKDASLKHYQAAERVHQGTQCCEKRSELIWLRLQQSHPGKVCRDGYFHAGSSVRLARLLPQQWTIIQVCLVELCQLHQAVKVVERHCP